MIQNSRFLNFNKFLEERSAQISKFMTDLQLDTKKKGHQSLPKSIRRRAMSHNRFRIPHKMRRNMEQELIKAQNMQKIPKCRKHIRKRRHLVMAYKYRNQKNKWLSTHLWAAKRMRMVDYCGYKVAFTPNDKSFRSAYRHFRHNCCLLDLSYYQCLVLSMKDAKNSILPANIKILGKQQKIDFEKLFEAEIYSNNLYDTLICPAYLIKSLSQQKTESIRLFFHPICLEQIQGLKFNEQYQTHLESEKMDMYMMLGPQSANILEKALKQYGITSQQHNLDKIFQTNSLKYLTHSQNHIIINKPCVTIPIRQQLLVKDSYQQSENLNLRRIMLMQFNQFKKPDNNQQNQEIKTFWRYYNDDQNKNFQNTTFKVTLRSKYTHKRKNKFSKQEKKKIIQSQRESSSQRNTPKPEKKMKDQNQMSNQFLQEKLIYVENKEQKATAKIQEINPILVAKIIKNQMFRGHVIFCSNANSCRFWRILTHLNTKVIGRRQYLHELLESGSPSFPQDYVQTKSFLIYSKQKQQKQFGKYCKLPTQKRPNYEKLNSPYPFSLGFQDLNKTVKISLQMVSRGKCFENSYICLLEDKDIEQASTSLADGKVGIVTSEDNNMEIERKIYKKLEEFSHDLRSLNTKRKVVGAVTSGGFLYSRCREGGIGFVYQEFIDNIQQSDGYVLLRKTTSPHYFLAKIVKIFN